MSSNAQTPVIFLAFSNDRSPGGDYLHNLPQEERICRDELRRAEDAGLCELIIRGNCTAQEIVDVFGDPRYHNRIAVFHFGGHSNAFDLLLETTGGERDPTDARTVASLLGQQRGLALVCLNGCANHAQSQGLNDAGVRCVISTVASIRDDCATDFARNFYRELSRGRSIDYSFHIAENFHRCSDSSVSRSLKAKSGGNAKNASPMTEWTVRYADGFEETKHWSLPKAAKNALFGLPDPPRRDLPESPFRYLEYYTRADAEVFFGRSNEIRDVYDRLIGAQGAPLVLLYGQTGVGKSSILDAGVIPRLGVDHEVRYLRCSECRVLTELQDELGCESPLAFKQAWQRFETQHGRGLFIIVDQLEDLLTENANDLLPFVDLIHGAFEDPNDRPQGKCLFGFRKEFLAEVETRLQSVGLPYSKVYLESMDRNSVIECVRSLDSTKRLREKYGLTIEEELPDIIADKLVSDPQSAIAPTLQVLLTRLWKEAKNVDDASPTFSTELYNPIQVQGIWLKDFLDQQLRELRIRHPREEASGLIIDLLLCHTTRSGFSDSVHESELARRYPQVSINDLIRSCKALHLLTVPVQRGRQAGSEGSALDPITRLAHDTLGPLLLMAADSSERPGQRARRLLDARLPQWSNGKLGPVFDESDLRTVELGQLGTRVWDDDESRLIDASRASRKSRVFRRRLAMLFGVAAMVTVIVLGIVAQKNARMAKISSDRYAIRVRIAEARADAETRPLRAIRQLVATFNEVPEKSDEYQKSLQYLREVSSQGRITHLGKNITDIAYSSESGWLFVDRLDSRSQIIELDRWKLVQHSDRSKVKQVYFRHGKDWYSFALGERGSEIRRVPDGRLVLEMDSIAPSISLSNDADQGWAFVHQSGYPNLIFRLQDGTIAELTDVPVRAAFGGGSASHCITIDYQGDIEPELRFLDERMTKHSFAKPVSALSWTPRPVPWTGRLGGIKGIRGSSGVVATDPSPRSAFSLLQVSYKDGSREVLRFENGKPVTAFQGVSPPKKFSKRGEYFQFNTTDGKRYLYRTIDCKPWLELPEDATLWEASPDNKERFVAVHYQDRIEINSFGRSPWSVKEAVEIKFLPRANSSECLLEFGSGKIQIRSTRDGSELRSWDAKHQLSPRSLSFPIGQNEYAVMQFGDGRKEIIQISSGRVAFAFSSPHRMVLQSIDINVDRGYFVVREQYRVPFEGGTHHGEPVARSLADGSRIIDKKTLRVKGLRAILHFSRVCEDPKLPFHLVAYEDGTYLFHLQTKGSLTLDPVGPGQELVIEPLGASGDYFRFVSKFENTSIIRSADLKVLHEFRTPVDSIDVLDEGQGILAVVAFQTGMHEIWFLSDESFRLVDLGANVGEVAFSRESNRAVVRYENYRAELLDIRWLKQLRGRSQELSTEELIQAAEQTALRQQLAPLRSFAK